MRSGAPLRRAIGATPQLAQKLAFCNSDLDKSTTVCRVGDLEVFMRCTPVRCTFMRYTPLRCTHVR